jgi:hypothetical protein
MPRAVGRDGPGVTTEALEQIGNRLARGSVVAPPITVITLDEVFGPSGAAPERQDRHQALTTADGFPRQTASAASSEPS